MLRIPVLLLITGLQAMSMPARGQVESAPATPARPVIATGSVPDEATKAEIIGRLNTLYGRERVIDQIEVDAVVAPPNWGSYVVGMLDEEIRQVSPGELRVEGNEVRLSGEVPSETQRQRIAVVLAEALNPTYTVRNQLEVGTDQQALLDQALADRIIEFRSGSASLTPRGQAILEEMAGVLGQIGESRVEIIGHTDAVGDRQGNVQLSLARASAVKAGLVELGIAADQLSVMGYGPDRPIADNDDEEGRARNRRIEFKVLQ